MLEFQGQKNVHQLGILTLSTAFRSGLTCKIHFLGDATYCQMRQLNHLNSAIENAQVYFNVPQFGAYAVRELTPYNRTLISSLLEPMPIVGCQYRRNSVSFWFNFRIYGNSGSRDRLYPNPVEAYINFGWLGILIIYGTISVLIALLQHFFMDARHDLLLTYISAHLNFLACASINSSSLLVGQFMFYGVLPIIAFMCFLSLGNEF